MQENHSGEGAKAERRSVQIPPSGVAADLCVPPNAKGVVLFAHGSGSSRFSPRNRFVAEVLQQRSLVTLLLDLLTPEEEEEDIRTGRHRFDIALLAGRLTQATEWVRSDRGTGQLPVGYFGASTGAGAALAAAAKLATTVRAVVSRGGRPDLANQALETVTAPTLLIVGGLDYPVIEMNQRALARLRCEKKLEIIPKATHLFEEPGALGQVARLAAAWVERYVS